MGNIKYILLTLFILSGITSAQDSPVLIEPPAGANVIGGAEISLNWNDVASATSYFFEVTTDTVGGPSFDDEFSNATTSDAVIDANTLDPNTVYYWRVKARFGVTYGPYSWYSSFRTAGTPQQEIARTQSLVSSMVSQNLIPNNQGNILNNRLNQASHQLDLEHYQVAELFIYLFKARVFILDISNVISNSTAETLQNEGDYIIAVIRNLGDRPVGGEQTTYNFTPAQYELTQNYPNPFNPSTTIEYSVPKNDFVSLKVYNTLGQEVKTLVSEQKDAGTYIVNFNAGSLSSGVYFYRLNAGTYTETKRMILTK